MGTASPATLQPAHKPFSHGWSTESSQAGTASEPWAPQLTHGKAAQQPKGWKGKALGSSQSCRLGPGRCSGSGCSQQQLPKQSCSMQVCAGLYCSPSSAFLENSYPFHQQSAPGKAPAQQMHRGKSLTEMGAEKRPGRNEEKRFSFVPEKGK